MGMVEVLRNCGKPPDFQRKSGAFFTESAEVKVARTRRTAASLGVSRFLDAVREYGALKIDSLRQRETFAGCDACCSAVAL